MIYTIPKCNIKYFHKALQSIGKVGNYLHFETEADKLVIKAFNKEKTAIIKYSFLQSFFSSLSGDTHSSRCKVHLKSLLLAFKSMLSTEKNVDSCQLKFPQDVGHIVVVKKCRFKISTTHQLPTMELEASMTMYSQEGQSYWTLPAKALADVVGTFTSGQLESTLIATSEGFQMKNYVLNFEDKHQVKTQLSMQPRDFEEYSIKEDSSLTFSLKELRSLISFAELIGQSVKASFSKVGDPIIFSVHQEMIIEVTYILSTMEDENGETEKLSKTPQPSRTAPNSQQTVNGHGGGEDNGEAPGGHPGEDRRSILRNNQHRHSTQRHLSTSRVCINSPSATPIAPRPSNNTTLHSVGGGLVHSHNFTTANNDISNHNNISDMREEQKRTGRKRCSDIFDLEEPEVNGHGDVVPRSPTRAIKRPKVFSKCFDITYNPSKLASDVRILAPDSDNDES